MRSLFRIHRAQQMSKQAEGERLAPDVARFIKEVDLIGNGDDNPARKEFLYRLISASKNVQKFLEDGARGYALHKVVLQVLAQAFNDAHPWVVEWAVKGIRDEIWISRFLPLAFQDAAQAKSFGPQHMRVTEAVLSVSESLDTEEYEFLKPMRAEIIESMLSGSMPAKVYAAAASSIMNDGECPWWASSWLMSELRKSGSGAESEVSPWLIETAKSMIVSTNPHDRREDAVAAWLEGLLSTAHPPDWITRLLSERFAETGHVPNFAYGWLQRTIARAVASKTPLPDAFVHGIEIHLQTAGDASFADPYVAMALEHGYATPKIQETYDVMREIFVDHIRNPGISPLDNNHPVPEWFPEQDRKTLNRQMAEASRR